MNNYIRFALGFTVGYLLVLRVMPFLVAKAESWDLDNAWDVFNTEAD